MQHNKQLSSIFVYLSFAIAHSLYLPGNDVVRLTDKNFNTKVTQSNKLWLVHFNSSADKHYPQFELEWDKVAKALKGIANVGVIDVDTEKQISIRYKIKGDLFKK